MLHGPAGELWEFFFAVTSTAWGFPGGSVVNNLPTNSGDVRSISGLERSPGEGNDNSLQYSCLGNPWTEEPGGLRSWARRVRHELATKQQHRYSWTCF